MSDHEFNSLSDWNDPLRRDEMKARWAAGSEANIVASTAAQEAEFLGMDLRAYTQAMSWETRDVWIGRARDALSKVTQAIAELRRLHEGALEGRQ